MASGPRAGLSGIRGALQPRAARHDDQRNAALGVHRLASTRLRRHATFPRADLSHLLQLTTPPYKTELPQWPPSPATGSCAINVPTALGTFASTWGPNGQR